MSIRDVQAVQEAVAEYWPDVRWVESTGSTNADMLREGEPGTVLIADEQTLSLIHISEPTRRS